MKETNKKEEPNSLWAKNQTPEERQMKELEGQIRKLNDKHSREIFVLQNKIQGYEKQLDFYSEHYPAAIGQRDAYAHEYRMITGSIYWKITKPLRVVGHAVKTIIKHIPGLVLLVKFLSHGRRSGFSEAMSITKNYLNREKGISNVAKSSTLSSGEIKLQKHTVFDKDITISILVPLYNTDEKQLSEMIESVIKQTYSKWELCLADGSDSEHAYVGEISMNYARNDKRIKYKKLEKNEGIAENTNRAIEMASGDYIGLLDHDDILHPGALFEVMNAICKENADYIYTDENTFNHVISDAHTPNFKPDFSPDTLRSYNYICHFSVFKKELLNKVGTFRSEFNGSQDYDMILRLTEQAEHIVHIPKILYYWRAHAGSVATDVSEKSYALDSAKKALGEHLERVGLNGSVIDGAAPSIYRIKYDISGEPLISILIPNKDHVSTLDSCLESIFNISTYKNFEIIIIENNSEEEETFEYYDSLKDNEQIRVVIWESDFNYSLINNFGAKHANGEYILLLNNDITVITPNWLEEMLMFAQRKDVGAVGAKLYYPDDTVQHAGTVIGLGGVAGHTHVGFPKDHPGYMRRLTIAQNLSAITAACMMMRKDVFNTVHGLDKAFKVAFNDVDLCMRIRAAGYLIVFTPYAELHHYESKSRGYEDTPEKQKRFASEIELFRSRWKKELAAGDPYYNINLTLDRNDFTPK